MITIDVAHPPMRQEAVEEELARAVAEVRNSRQIRVLKVIHGYGSTGAGGITREVVRNWAFRHRRGFRTVMTGEEYSLFAPETGEMVAEVGPLHDPDLSSPNPGITIIWVH